MELGKHYEVNLEDYRYESRKRITKKKTINTCYIEQLKLYATQTIITKSKNIIENPETNSNVDKDLLYDVCGISLMGKEKTIS